MRKINNFISRISFVSRTFFAQSGRQKRQNLRPTVNSANQSVSEYDRQGNVYQC